MKTLKELADIGADAAHTELKKTQATSDALWVQRATSGQIWDNDEPARQAFAQSVKDEVLADITPPVVDGKTPGQVAYAAFKMSPALAWEDSSYQAGFNRAASAVLAAFGGQGLEAAITKEQIRQYRCPPNPAKEDDALALWRSPWLGAPLRVLQQPVVPQVDRVHAGRGRDAAERLGQAFLDVGQPGGGVVVAGNGVEGQVVGVNGQAVGAAPAGGVGPSCGEELAEATLAQPADGAGVVGGLDPDDGVNLGGSDRGEAGGRREQEEQGLHDCDVGWRLPVKSSPSLSR